MVLISHSEKRAPWDERISESLFVPLSRITEHRFERVMSPKVDKVFLLLANVLALTISHDSAHDIIDNPLSGICRASCRYP